MDLRERLDRGDILLSDGAIGTLLQQHGLEPGQAPEAFNLSRPELLSQVAATSVEAGSDLVHTNSFGGSPLKLAVHGLEDQAGEINRTAATAAVRGVAGRALVSGSIGPCGKVLLPYGEADPDEVRAGFLLQARALLEGGADLLTIETMSDLAEAVLAVQGARRADPGVPILVTMTFESTPGGWFTIMGNDIPTCAATLLESGADVLGSNCGQGSAGMLEVARAFAATTDRPLMIQANAGLPELDEGRACYPESPADMAAWVPKLVANGVRILGGCCGTTTQHIRAFRRVLDQNRDSA
ncbi:MAG: homocysteine S-methyltransferase family protein [Gemmatimonadales bacterium]|nr:homocysteine S-methyltransferase family protein [Gemmatimonadales bacterium]